MVWFKPDLVRSPVCMLEASRLSSIETLCKASYNFFTASECLCLTSVTKALLLTINFYESVILCFDWSFLSFWIFWSKVFIAAACCFLKVSALSYAVDKSSLSFFCNSNIFSCSISSFIFYAFSYSCDFTNFFYKSCNSTTLFENLTLEASYSFVLSRNSFSSSYCF